MKVIITKRSKGFICDAARRGRKRQRKKYRHAFITLCGDGCYCIGKHYENATMKDWLRYERAERRRGYPMPTNMPYEHGIVDPQWHGVRGMIGMFWTWDPHGRYWYGRT